MEIMNYEVVNERISLGKKSKTTILTKLFDIVAGSMRPEPFKLFVLDYIKKKCWNFRAFEKTLEQQLDLFSVENEFCVRVLAYIMNNVLVIQVIGDNIILHFETPMDRPT